MVELDSLWKESIRQENRFDSDQYSYAQTIHEFIYTNILTLSAYNSVCILYHLNQNGHITVFVMKYRANKELRKKQWWEMKLEQR